MGRGSTVGGWRPRRRRSCAAVANFASAITASPWSRRCALQAGVDAIDVLILVLRLLFVALLYAFVVVVLRTAMGATSRSRTAQRLNLRVVEAGSSDLQPGEVLALAAGTTLGRGARADIVLADTAVSAEHARVDRVGRRWLVTDLGSTNGTRVNESVVRGRAALAEGDVLALGTIRFEVVAR